MKKIFTLAAVAALVLSACAKIETETPVVDNAINFGVYAGNSVTKATYGDITTSLLQTSTDGFGVFAYYTLDVDWADTDTPNFMYNQQVRHISSYASNPTDYTAEKYPSSWYYAPLKYWPNGQNSTTVESGTFKDKISFFAYAPHIATADLGTIPASGQGITAMSANNAADAPTLSFTVPAKTEEQIDLLYATPLMNQTHQNLAGRVAFTFNHALAKLNIQAQAVVDAVSPTTGNLTDDGDDTFEEGETWIILESLEIKADDTQSGTLNLKTGVWSDVDGESVITYTNTSFAAANVKTANGKTGFKVTEAATDLNSAISPMIIPAEIASGKYVVTANYWVITKDTALSSGYSTVQQVIKKTSTAAVTFDKGKKYNIVVRLGLNSLDFNVTAVTDWTTAAGSPVDLPINS